MYAVDAFPSQYYEERAAADAVKRLAEQQQAAALEAQAKAPIATQQSSPSMLQQAIYQPRPPLARAGSATVLGTIFQNFMKRAPSTPGISASTTPTRGSTPTPPVSLEEQQKRDAEALLAEMKRDADICALPGWR